MSVVEEIKERLDVVDVISAYVPLRKSGRNFKGLCPFHQEKTPSFVVFPDTGTWRCFGACGIGGDVFSFIMKRENADFREALEILAQKAGVNLAPPSSAQSQREQYLERLREINQAAATYFHHLLLNASHGQVARDYLAGRGLDAGTIEAFQLGYALDRWDALMQHLLAQGYQLEDLHAAGLVVEKTHDDGRTSHYDRFRNRVIVPIRDTRGRVIGFGARALASDQQPKYLNTPQTPLFDKSSVLFGLDKARRAVRERDQAVIVEGYMDVLAAFQHGEPNIVASMGTALTEQQLKRLKRYTNRFVLALDADTAGQAATLRGITQAREALDREWVPTVTATGLVRHETRLAAQLRIMTLPEGQDPDDVIRSNPDQWQALVDQALPVVDFFMELMRQEVDLNSAQGKSEAVQRLTPLIQEVADDIQRAHYIQQLARLVQSDERTVERLVLRRQPDQKPRPPVPEPPPDWEDWPPVEEPYADDWSEEDLPGGEVAAAPPLQPSPATYCLSLLVRQPELLPWLQAELAEAGASPLDEDDFGRTEERAVCAALLAGDIREGGVWPDCPPALTLVLAQLRASGGTRPALSRTQVRKDVVDSVLRLRIANLKDRTRQLPALARSAEAEGLVDEAKAYRQALRDLSQHRLLLEQALNARTHSGRRQATPSYQVTQDG